MTDGSIIHRPPNDIPSPSIHVGYSFIYPPILLSVSLPLLRLKEHTIMISFWNNHAHSTILTTTVSGRLLSSCVPLALTSHSHCPFSSHSACLPTRASEPLHLPIQELYALPDALPPLPHFSTTKRQLSATNGSTSSAMALNHPVRGSYMTTHGRVEINRRQWAEYGRPACLCELSEL